MRALHLIASQSVQAISFVTSSTKAQDPEILGRLESVPGIQMSGKGGEPREVATIA